MKIGKNFLCRLVIAISIPATLLPLRAAYADELVETYRDDRSTAEALVRSLYNAIDRKEYLRAWSYFSEEARPGDPEAFARGYEQTETVAVRVGEAVEEGAAGSVYTQLPVVIRADMADGTVRVFAGCYITRLSQPANQATPPFVPLRIVAGKLDPSEATFEEARGSCEGVSVE